MQASVLYLLTVVGLCFHHSTPVRSSEFCFFKQDIRNPGADTELFQFFPSLSVAQIPRSTLTEYTDAWTPPRKDSATEQLVNYIVRLPCQHVSKIQTVEKKMKEELVGSQPM